MTHNVFSGESIECDGFDENSGSEAVFGRCQSTGLLGNCHESVHQSSHEIQCCQSDTKLDKLTCGWIYANSGTKIDCPRGHAIGGLCGVHEGNKCQQQSDFGIQCCKPLK